MTEKLPKSALSSNLRLYDAAFYIAVFFILGIAAASLKLNGYIVLLAAAFIAATLYLTSHNRILALLVFIIPFGAFYYNFYTVSHKPLVPLGDSVALEGVISNEPQERSGKQIFTVSLMRPYSGSVEVYLPAYPRLQYGDLLKLTGKVEKNIYAGRPNEMYLPKAEFVKSGQGNALQAFLFKLKDSLAANIDEVLPAEKSALMKGLIFGERAEFTKQFNDALKKSGTTHIVALSGYNIAIIGIVLSDMLAFICSRRKAFWITILFTILFVLMTGAEPSAVRAAIMGTMLLIAERSSRLYSFRNAIALAAALMLVFNPTLLMFNAGFELSFAALLGIVILGPMFKKWLRADKTSGFLNWRKNLAETTAAQVGTLPVSLAVFGFVAPLAPLSNLLVLELVPTTMFFGFITALLGYLSSGFSLVVGWVVNMLLGYEIFIINLFGAHLS
jgi:competence protein ComEC